MMERDVFTNFDDLAPFQHDCSSRPGIPHWSRRVLCRLYVFPELRLGVEVCFRGVAPGGQRMYDVTRWRYEPRTKHFWFDYSERCTSGTTFEAKAIYDVSRLARRVRRIRDAAATCIQRHFRGWRDRMHIAWNMNTIIGRGLQMLRIKAELRLDMLSCSGLSKGGETTGVVGVYGPIRECVA